MAMASTAVREPLLQQKGRDCALFHRRRSVRQHPHRTSSAPPSSTTRRDFCHNFCSCWSVVGITALAAAALVGSGIHATAATPATGPEADWSVTSTSTTTAAGITCSATEWCASDNNCTQCFTALWPSLFVAVSVAEQIVLEVDFLSTLRNTTSCSPPNLAHALFAATLIEMHQNQTCLAIFGKNASELGTAQFDFCQIYEYKCFVDSDCNACLSRLHDASSSKTRRSVARVLESAACNATAPALISELSIFCLSFPTCTLSKTKCNESTQCQGCWEKLVNDMDGAAAARGCQAGETAHTMDYLAGRCMSRTRTSCAFFLERCATSQYCNQCLDEIGDVNALSGTGSILRGLSTSACVDAMEFGSDSALYNVFRNCPQYTPCQRATATCAITSYECFECLNGTAEYMRSEVCEAVFSHTEYVAWSYTTEEPQ